MTSGGEERNPITADHNFLKTDVCNHIKISKCFNAVVGWSWHYGADCALGNPDELIE